MTTFPSVDAPEQHALEETPRDFSLVTRAQTQEWYDALLDAHEALGVSRTTPIPVRDLAQRAGIAPRVALYALRTNGWKLEEYTYQPPPEAQPSPERLRHDYVTVEEAAERLGVSKSHIYVTLRDPSHQVETLYLAHTRLIAVRDLEKLRPMRTSTGPVKATKATKKATNRRSPAGPGTEARRRVALPPTGNEQTPPQRHRIRLP